MLIKVIKVYVNDLKRKTIIWRRNWRSN